MTTLDCTDIQAMLSAIVDGELEPAARHTVERHLAGCKPCRDLVSESERLNQMITLDVQGMMTGLGAGGGLPAGFESAVLGQTVHANRALRLSNRQRITSWAGWLAGAACLSLAMSIWFLDRQGAARLDVAHNDGSGGIVNPNASVIPSLARNRSWTFNGELSPQLVATLDRSRKSSADDSVSDETYRQIDDQLALVQPVSYRTATSNDLEQLSLSPVLGEDDADTLIAAGTLLDMLAQADLNSFGDADKIRQIAEYDDMLARLAETRSHLAVADRPAVMAAESLLLRLVRGPVSLGDLREMRETATAMKLSDQVNAIGSRGVSNTTL